MKQPITSPLYNYIRSGMFKSFYWKRPLLFSSLLTEALETFPAQWIINLPPLCLHPILDNPPCMVRDRERERETAYPALAPNLSLSPLTHTHRHICPWVSHNNKGSVMASSTHLLNTYKLTKQFQKNIPLLWGSFQSNLNGSSQQRHF